MKIYFAHSQNFDFKQQLYQPIRESALNAHHQIIFPHEKVTPSIKTKELIKTCDFVFAEISFPSTGLGIELGWTDASNIPIVCVYRTGSAISTSLQLITKNFIEYSDAQDLINKFSNFLSKNDC